MNAVVREKEAFFLINLGNIYEEYFPLGLVETMVKFSEVAALIDPLVSEEEVEDGADLVSPLESFHHFGRIFYVLTAHDGSDSGIGLEGQLSFEFSNIDGPWRSAKDDFGFPDLGS